MIIPVRLLDRYLQDGCLKSIMGDEAAYHTVTFR